MKKTGADILMECLLEQEVDTIFGYPGGTILSVYDALYRYRKRFRHILTSHEQGAAHAADGYYRATGRTGVCFATSGPGATNLTTGIATAYYDSSAVVFITCNVSENLLGRDAFQEVDITGISMPITKASYLVDDVARLADTVREAFYLASSGRPGPVVIDILKNVTDEKTDYVRVPRQQHPQMGHLAQLVARAAHRVPRIDYNDPALEEAAALLEGAERPVVMIGGGVIRAGASELALQIVERLDAVATCTTMALGAIPSDHPNFVGFAGMHGTRAANAALSSCDVLLAVGTRFSDRVALNPRRFAEQAKIIQIDVERAEINKNVLVDLGIVGDAKQTLRALLPDLPQKDCTEWRGSIDALREEPLPEEPVLTPAGIVRACQRLAGADAQIVTDVGQHQMWTAQYFPFRYPNQFISSGGFGTMGFGLGAAMGAKIGRPDRTVLHLTGDGSFRMNCNELATVQHYDIPVITLIFNNGVLGMVRQWQTLLCGGRYSQTTLDRGPDFKKLAEAYGVAGYCVRTPEELDAALSQALASGHAAVIDCRLPADETVRPMVPGGAELTDYILE
ncbi:MAG: biosynthetic-type acetolactate synthase large subunit [Oscillospiraceae bacterium]|nr:biosynthetic-type acetolactate synthase large subunit [Oscillospiraceae bacterium]